nr:hypothetical protein FJN17_12235 [Bradyrhizobium symbiodeficiens]
MSGEMEIQWAVDMLQNFAEQRGLIAEIGQDKVQDIMAAAFMWARACVTGDEAEREETRDPDYAQCLVHDWELADFRDRWRWTGELPPTQQAIVLDKPQRSTPQATIDAFHYVLSLGDPERLATWLRQHPDDALALFKSVEAA